MSSGRVRHMVFGCKCLNVRLNVESTADSRISLENITNVLECRLGEAPAVEVGLNALVEVKPGSSVDRSINVVRCLLCKSPVLYFRKAAAAGLSPLLGMPLAHSEGFLAQEAKNPEQVLEIQKNPEYSKPFGILLLPEFANGARSRPGGTHVPREIQQKATEFMQRQEIAKDERVREYIRAQDRALETVRNRTMDECALVADIINAVHPQTTAAPPVRREPSAASGLAAMLRGPTNGGSSSSRANNGASRQNPMDRRLGTIGNNGQNSDDELGGVFGLADAVDSMALRGGTNASSRRNNNAFGTQQPDDFSGNDEDDEEAFGDFAQLPPHSFAPVQMTSQQQQRGGNLAPMLAGSMPIQIPTFGSGSVVGGHSLSRRELQHRAEEIEQNRRKEQFTRDLPKTFVPPHQLLDQMHENDTDLIIGSKPRDSYGFGRRYAPG
ncbi:hypothetical protein FB645_005792 [Coemansia sp. IMI 203386]|nr:hypothetical protein FB645_005792 [Coemansia sp. IMI 203386]